MLSTHVKCRCALISGEQKAQACVKACYRSSLWNFAVIRRKVLAVKRAIVIAVLLFAAATAGAQSPPQFPPLTGRVQLKSYLNDTLGFELSYPANYTLTELPCENAMNFVWQGRQLLLYATTGSGGTRGSMTVALDRRHFDLKTIGAHYEHTGWAEAVPFDIESGRFYYIGAGGGGVSYPDSFFYNLGGYILLIEFDGPYPPNSKSLQRRRGQSRNSCFKAFECVANPNQTNDDESAYRELPGSVPVRGDN